MASVTKMTREGSIERPVRDGEKLKSDQVFYQVRWKTPDRSTRKKNFSLKRDAEQHAASVETTKATGNYLDPMQGKQLFGDYAVTLLKVKAAAVTERTWINLDGRLRNHLEPVLAERPLVSITAEDVRVLLADLTLEKKLSPSSVKPVYSLLNMIMTKAVIDKKIPFNPCDGIDTKTDLPREEEGEEMHFLRPDQVTRLAETIEPRFRALIYTAAYSGLRAGELSALRVSRTPLSVERSDRVKPIRPQLFVAEAHSEVRGRLTTKSTKNRRRRWVPIPKTLVDVLAEHVGSYPSPDGYIFTAPDGGPIRHHNFYIRHYKPAVRQADLPPALRFHDLRHTAAAILIDQGCNEKQLQVILGDTSRAIERYKHLFDGHEEVLMERMDDTLAENLGSVWGPSSNSTSLPHPISAL